MMDAGTKIILAILSVAILAVIVGKNAQTSAVLQAFGTAFSQILTVVVSPVTTSGNTTGVQ